MRTSLAHLPENKQKDINDIRTIILNDVEGFLANKTGKQSNNKVVWIILFGSYARGDYVDNQKKGYISDSARADHIGHPANAYLSDFDILVVVNHLDLLTELALWNTIEEKANRLTGSPLTLLIHTQKEVLEWLEQGHYFFSDIQKEGVYLHSQNGKPLPEPMPLSNSERLDVAQKHFEQWFDSANSFLKQFKYAINDKELKIAAFLLHQAVERYYSCLLLVLKNYRPRTHDIKTLRHLCIEADTPDSPLETIFAENNRFERRCFELLKRAYIDSRYSEHYKINEEELQWLKSQTEQLKGSTKDTCQQYLNDLQNIQ